MCGRGARSCRDLLHALAVTALLARVFTRRPPAARSPDVAGNERAARRREHRAAHVGSGVGPPVVSLAVDRAARARAAIAHRAVPRWHPHRPRRAADPAGCARRGAGTSARAGFSRRLLAAVGHGGGGRHLVRAGVAAPAARARDRRAVAGLPARAAAPAARDRSAPCRAPRWRRGPPAPWLRWSAAAFREGGKPRPTRR